jgi:hypothetical protein
MPYPCFLITPVHKIRVWLRRYDGNYPHERCPSMPGEWSTHEADSFLLGDFDYPHVSEETEDWIDFVETLRPPKNDPRWPKVCKCGLQFPDTFEWQMFTHRVYERSDTHELTTMREAPAGALWYAWWMKSENGYSWEWDNQTTPSLICRTPGGEWNIDSRASNCTMPEDRTHRCWIRHGEPPNIHVDKNGFTCQAGAGSIISGNYHGFLHNGSLT